MSYKQNKTEKERLTQAFEKIVDAEVRHTIVLVVEAMAAKAMTNLKPKFSLVVSNPA